MTSDDSGTLLLQPGEAEAGLRLDKWLSDQLPEMSRSRIKALILEGHLRRDGEVWRTPRSGVRPGEHYRLCIPEPVSAEPEAEAMPLDILHEDTHLLVLNKSAGLVVHPAPGAWSGTLVNALLSHCGDSLSGIGGVMRPGIVHRLDKDTSGVMVVAKTQKAHTALAEMFAVHSMQRVYLALTIGAPVPSDGEIETLIGRSRTDHRKMAVVTDQQRGRRARTLYRRLRGFGEEQHTARPVAALLECQLKTGRTHQIRVHMAHMGTPLIGDPLYGGRRGLRLKPDVPVASAVIDIVRGFSRQALHARGLGFEHPVTGQTLRFEVPPPPDFADLAEALAGLGG